MIEINEKLKNSILSSLPANASNIEKVVYIYYQLCLKTQYSFDYYLEEKKFRPYFINVENIKYVDGEENQDVVCFTFNAIFMQLLVDAGICSQKDFDENISITTEGFSPFHKTVCFKVDGIDLCADSTLGILDNNDLVLSKYLYFKPKGLIVASDEGKKVLDAAIEKVIANKNEAKLLEDEYLKIKGEDIERISLQERVNMFFEGVKNMQVPYSILAFSYLLKLKRKLFSIDELGRRDKQNIELIFAKDQQNGELQAYLFYNPKGYYPDFKYENFDNLQIYKISLKQQKISPISIEEMKELIKERKITARLNYPLAIPNMMQKGNIRIRPDLKKFEPNKPLTLNGYIRTILSTGEEEKLTIEEYHKLEEERCNS